jgi:hypothetical protein
MLDRQVAGALSENLEREALALVDQGLSGSTPPTGGNPVPGCLEPVEGPHEVEQLHEEPKLIRHGA